MNYFMQVFIQQGGEWRIAESIVAPTDQIVANGDGFGTEQEKEYGKRRECEITSLFGSGYKKHCSCAMLFYLVHITVK